MTDHTTTPAAPADVAALRAAIEARLAAATPGRWYSNQTEPAPYEIRSGALATPDMLIAVVPEYGLNADLIAHAPADLRALLAALAASEARAEALRAALLAGQAREAALAVALGRVANEPSQPLYTNEHGTRRFKMNAIVRYLLDRGPFDMNHLAVQGFSDEDAAQFAQLIGYSLSGWGDLSYVSDAAYERATLFEEDTADAMQAQGAALLAAARAVLIEDEARQKFAAVKGGGPVGDALEALARADEATKRAADALRAAGLAAAGEGE